jgi:hypothetical protein
VRTSGFAEDRDQSCFVRCGSIQASSWPDYRMRLLSYSSGLNADIH